MYSTRYLYSFAPFAHERDRAVIGDKDMPASVKRMEASARGVCMADAYAWTEAREPLLAREGWTTRRMSHVSAYDPGPRRRASGQPRHVDVSGNRRAIYGGAAAHLRRRTAAG